MWQQLAYFVLILAIFSPPSLAADADDYRTIQSLLLDPKPGAVIQLPKGRFELSRGLSLVGNSVTLKGHGPKQTILSFKRQKHGPDGLLAQGENLTLTGFSIIDSLGDGLKVVNSKTVTIDNVHVTWTKSSDPKNGAYGIYPVQSEDVKILNSQASHASEAGIYLGQTKRGEIRNCTSFANIAGIEVENSQSIVVAENQVHGNSIGLIISELPDLSVNSKGLALRDNKIFENNADNFVKRSENLAYRYQGYGLMITGAKGTEVSNNVFESHKNTHILVNSLENTHFASSPKNYNPLPLGTRIGENQYRNSKTKTQQSTQFFRFQFEGGRHEVVWDGQTYRNNILKSYPREQVICFDKPEPLSVFKLNSGSELMPFQKKQLLCSEKSA